MNTTKFFCLMMLAIAIAPGTRLVAQVQTDVPPVVPGAKPVTAEHIKVHGTALERNLEGDPGGEMFLIALHCGERYA